MAQYEQLTIDRGSDVFIELHLQEQSGIVKNLTGYSVAAKMKRTYNSDSSDTTTFTTQITEALNGKLQLSLTNAQTDLLKPGKYVYDVEISFNDSDGDTFIERILEGNIDVTPSVTR